MPASLITGCKQRCEIGNTAGNFPNQEITAGPREGPHHCITYVLKPQTGAALPNVSGTDEEVRRNRRPQVAAPITLVLPSAVQQCSARSRRICRNITGVEQDNRTDRTAGDAADADQPGKLSHGGPVE